MNIEKVSKKHDNTVGSSSGSGSSGQSLSCDQHSKTNLKFCNLLPTMTDQKLVTLCQCFGKIVSAKAIMDDSSILCKGYGFVDFETASDAEEAEKTLRMKGYTVQMAEERNTRNLYIANLEYYVRGVDLVEFFSPGLRVKAHVLLDQKSISSGAAFLEMQSDKDCEVAIQEFDGQYIPCIAQPLIVKFAYGKMEDLFIYSHLRPWVGYKQGSDQTCLLDTSSCAAHRIKRCGLFGVSFMYPGVEELNNEYLLQYIFTDEAEKLKLYKQCQKSIKILNDVEKPSDEFLEGIMSGIYVLESGRNLMTQVEFEFKFSALRELLYSKVNKINMPSKKELKYTGIMLESAIEAVGVFKESMAKDPTGWGIHDAFVKQKELKREEIRKSVEKVGKKGMIDAFKTACIIL